ncbi:Pre-mRNA splicing factor PRP21 like protein-domain-containing protein [Zychaea mexicana]|uniref:Pre-mRNA splicing factor PRP21 like protein-domain-containing protein n=1 Tax=Zychaea mexicana TaxID=64656 RepID=UPI0022FDC4F9|nr:Pre-mRNA splicing factor PRP21 like protein-domain-containing protein [Zychaea mexicana]KAI9489315.1 Pre-mRNA splicing factor PRP21 like protein-domain-containing protein [Zychaea mexicana]
MATAAALDQPDLMNVDASTNGHAEENPSLPPPTEEQVHQEPSEETEQQTEENGESKPIVGIIYPPPNIRETIDTAAGILANKPPQLEDRIRENEKHNAKFCFLNPSDPYHAYYQFKLQEVREGKVPVKAAAKEEKEVIEAEEIEMRPKEPEAFQFSASMPAMSAQDLDIMKLTAQFAARNGRQFINQLAQRESRNYQFDFLRPSHSLFPFFTELVRQYTKVLAPPADLKEKLKENTQNKYRILSRVKERVEWVAWVEAEKKKKADEDEKERIAYATIDWHDFVIVETVEFTETDDNMDLPPPMSLSELENMSLAEKRMNAIIQPAQEEKPGDVEMDIEDVDMEESDNEEEEAAQQAQQVKVPDTNAPFKIRTDYKPKVLGAAQAKGQEPTQICPRCGERIPMSEMDEHMRIELLDPKWKEQKLAAEAKKKDSNLLQEGTDVAKILKNFSGYRTDIFGSEETEIGKKVHEEEQEEAEDAMKKERVIWDGHSATINLATQRAQQHTSIEEQIAAIHRSKGFTGDGYGPAGPRMPGSNYPDPSMAPPQPGQQPYYSAPPPSGSVPIPDGGAFNNQLPNMYAQPQQQLPPQPTMNTPEQPAGGDAGVRKAEDELEGQSEAKRARMDSHDQTQTQASPAAPATPMTPATPAKAIPTPAAAGTPTGAAPLGANTAANTGAPQWSDQPLSITLNIATPNMPEKPEWNLKGETITISDMLPSTLVSTVKDRISSQLGMPAGKQKLSTTGNNVVLNNSKSLHFYGIMDGNTITLGLKERGKK